ncbi:hypothetical protein [Mucilaginibacter sp. L3T2-6]|uniref:hypothetical protein n=1 Tax=Mucilaginibacter sp. L3T2-6 TaxID=3062491 RepID=UPI002675DD63|nr:hypothetical protein [Mucilaginibacter sp. L3T2-6]MDO3643105.1 hypothetical protein [Mucilaginibacter sp. L3T2-6]MDV6215872.1 hypothetical protein [Mucilaginibacter sp. L3T2-6]
MKRLIVFIITTGLTFNVSAQFKSDSIAYQQQRKKINAMLAERTKKFGLYDESLSKHTGIFGFQTKKDIRRSNDILMDIVKTDNNIYKELKILLEFRTFQQKQVQTKSKEAESSNLGYMTTINTLRAQMDALRRRADKEEMEHEKTRNTLMLVIIGICVVIIGWMLFRPRKRLTATGKKGTTASRRRK